MTKFESRLLLSSCRGVVRGAGMMAATFAIAGTLERTASAHRLDEYLQAAQISVSKDAVRLDLSITPGAAVAAGFIATIDGNGDGEISTPEANAYASRALQSMTLSVDGQPLTLRLVSTDPATPASLLAGEGFLRVRAEASLAAPAPEGAHELRFENRLDLISSVYLGNAMLPEDRAIAITEQDHGTNQSTLLIRYRVRAEESVAGLWAWLIAAAGVVGAGLLIAPRILRVRRNRTTSAAR